VVPAGVRESFASVVPVFPSAAGLGKYSALTLELTKTVRTAGCGPACPAVWEG